MSNTPDKTSTSTSKSRDDYPLMAVHFPLRSISHRHLGPLTVRLLLRVGASIRPWLAMAECQVQHFPELLESRLDFGQLVVMYIKLTFSPYFLFRVA